MANLRQKIKNVARPILPKPWNSPVMESRYGIWIGVSALFSESGRQLGEGNARPFNLNAHLPVETITCKYAGSRNGRSINMSALRIAMKHFDEALKITDAVRKFHMEKSAHLSGNSQPGIWDLYIIARASVALIAYRQRHMKSPFSRSVTPDSLASQYQLIAGVFMICREMMANGEGAIRKNESVSAASLYDYAEEYGVFISPNGMACAGSTKKIMDFLEFCISGGGQEAEQIELDDLVGDAENWYNYALSAIELDCFVEAEAARRRAQRSADNDDADNGDNADGAATSENDICTEETMEIYQSLARYIGDIWADMPAADQQASFVQGILNRQNNILRLLERKPVSKLSQAHIDARLGL